MSKNYARTCTKTRAANSLFHCLKKLKKDKKTIYHIRCKCAGYVEDSIDRSKPHPLSVHVKGNTVIMESWDDYIATIGKSGTHVDEKMLCAASKYLGCELVIVEKGPQLTKSFIYNSRPNPVGWVISPFHLKNPVTIERYNEYCYRLPSPKKKDPTKIQALFRGWRIRKAMRSDASATKIQALFKGWRVRSHLDQFRNLWKLGIGLLGERRREAATKIQALFRGYRQRYSEEELDYELPTQEDRDAAEALEMLMAGSDSDEELDLQKGDLVQHCQWKCTGRISWLYKDNDGVYRYEVPFPGHPTQYYHQSDLLSLEDDFNDVRSYKDKKAFLRQIGYTILPKKGVRSPYGQQFRTIKAAMEFVQGKVPEKPKFKKNDALNCKWGEDVYFCVCEFQYPDGDYEVHFPSDGSVSKVSEKLLTKVGKRKRTTDNTPRKVKLPKYTLLTKYSTA